MTLKEGACSAVRLAACGVASKLTRLAEAETALLGVCQSAFNIDPQSACKIDPPERHGGGCPGSQ